MKFRQLEYVDQIIRHGTMREAAQQLFISEPSISQQIRKLEDKFGFPIFTKQGRGLQITEHGQQILPLIQNILAAVKELEYHVENINNPAGGVIKFGTIEIGAIKILPNLITDFYKKYSNVVVDVSQESPLKLIEQLKINELDIIVTRIPLGERRKLEQSGFNCRTISKGKPLIAVASKHSKLAKQKTISINDLYQEHILLANKGYFVLEEIISNLNEDIKNNVVYSSVNGKSNLQLVQSGLGITIIPPDYFSLWSLEYPDLVGLEFNDWSFPLDICCIYKKDRYQPKYFESFINLMLKQRELFLNEG